jgi:hypothetical protein
VGSGEGASAADQPLTAARGQAEPDGVTLGTVLDLLEAQKAEALADILSPASLVDAITALIGHGLVSNGTAVWTPAWTGASRMVAMDVDADRLRGWVAHAVDDPAEVGWLRLRLAGLRVDPDALAIPTDEPVPGSAGRVTKAKAVPDTRRRARTIALVSLSVLLTLLACGGLRWLGADESPAPASSPGVLPSYSNYSGPASAYPPPDFRVPTFRVPTDLIQTRLELTP